MSFIPLLFSQRMSKARQLLDDDEHADRCGGMDGDVSEEPQQ